MMSPRRLAVLVLLLAIGIGTVNDRPRVRPPISIGGYRVLAADFHLHSSWSDGALTPWGLVLEAERQGLDAIAITGHNLTIDGKVGRWFSQRIGGPTVLAGEEILATPKYHLIAAGISRWVSFQQPAASAIDEIHRQGGIAIAAHPLQRSWDGYDAAAIERLDGAEICHPIVYGDDRAQAELEHFAARGTFAAIGSSDFHGLGQLGVCRTYVFARDASEEAILEAVRARRTVVYGRDGKAFGDPALIRLAGENGRLREGEPPNTRGTTSDWFSRLGLLGLALAVFGPRGRRD